MKKYNFKIEETLERTVTVEAETKADAQEIIENMCKNCELNLDANDFSGIVIRYDGEVIN